MNYKVNNGNMEAYKDAVIEVPAGSTDTVKTDKKSAIEARLKANNDKRLKDLADRQEADAEDKVADEDWKVIDVRFSKEFSAIELQLTEAEAKSKEFAGD